MIESFLLGEKSRGVDELESFETDYILRLRNFGDDLHFRSELVRRTVARIGRSDDSILDEHDDWIRTSLNFFQKDPRLRLTSRAKTLVCTSIAYNYLAVSSIQV